MIRRFDPILIATVFSLIWVALVVSVLADTLTGTQARTVDAMTAGVPPAAAASSNRDPEIDPISLTIEPGDGVDTIAALLVEEGVLTDAERFRTLLLLTGVSTELRADTYQFAPNSPAAEVIRQLRTGVARERFFVVHEGLRVEEIGDAMVTLGLATQEEWELAIRQPRTESILSGRPRAATLNGYLFPATYPIDDETTAESLIAAMIEALDGALDQVLRGRIELSSMTLHEVLTLASIVERETLLRDEMPLVASVFHNRLDVGVKLDADPTVQYAITTNSSREPVGRLVEDRADPRRSRLPVALQHLPGGGSAARPDRQPAPRCDQGGAQPGGHGLLLLRGARRRLPRLRRDARRAQRERRRVPRPLTPPGSPPAHALRPRMIEP